MNSVISGIMSAKIIRFTTETRRTPRELMAVNFTGVVLKDGLRRFVL
jgi:hypothetical protein